MSLLLRSRKLTKERISSAPVEIESTIIEKAYELTYIGGQYGVQKPTDFMCLVLKLLQLQPREQIVIKYITGLTESENNK